MQYILPSLSSIFSPVYPLCDFLYIVQSEDYRTDRYLHWLPRFFFRRHIEVRGHVVWTQRALLIATSAIILNSIVTLGVYLLFGILFSIFYFVFSITLLTPLYVLWSHALTAPLFTLLHRRMWVKSKSKITSMPDMQVVLIVGSYGKTTARAYVTEMLRHTHTVATPPGNINTETGVAHWIAHSLPTNTNILILEADAYAAGDIARMCDIAQPHIAVITALGDQHMERLGTREALVAATAEVFTNAHETASLIARADVWDELQKHGGPSSVQSTAKKKVNADHIHADYADCENNLVALPHTQRSAGLLALAVAHVLHIPARFALPALTHTTTPHRRQELKKIHAGAVAYDGLDDSYNISLTTALAALSTARAEATKLRKKLLVVVAGIPEAQDAAGDNTKLALACLETAEHTVVIDSMYTQYFTGVFAREKSKCTVLPSIKNSVLLELPERFQHDEWFVLLFNELGDLYH
jgi:UDP-N-acetylmuramyl pentapeptide synthase